MPKDWKPSQGTPDLSSSLEVEDASINFRVRRSQSYKWHVIQVPLRRNTCQTDFPRTTKTPEFLQLRVVGSTIYDLGGIDTDDDFSPFTTTYTILMHIVSSACEYLSIKAWSIREETMLENIYRNPSSMVSLLDVAD